MADVDSIVANILAQQAAVLKQENTVLTKAEELLGALNNASRRTLGRSLRAEPRQISIDAVGVLHAFENTGGQLNVVNDASYTNEWVGYYKTYGDLLNHTATLAVQASGYVLSFHETVVNHFSQGNIDWEKDKNLIADFINTHPGQELIDKTREDSQKFTDLRRNTEAFEKRYSDYAAQRGEAYDANAKALDDKKKELQARIESNQTAAAKIQRALRAIAGAGFLFGWLVAGVLAALGIISVDEALQTLGVLDRDEQELRRQKAEVERQAGELANQESALKKIRNVLATLVADVADIAVRLDTLAQSWADAHHNFVELGQLLQNATDSASQTGFLRRLNLIAESTSALSADMHAYIDALAPGGVVDLQTYSVSAQYGGSDFGGSARSFGDIRSDLDTAKSIFEIKVVHGWVVDGIHVTYRLNGGSTRTEYHGTDRSTGDRISLKTTEYVSAVTGKSGKANNGEPWMGDCVQQISFEITDSATGAKRTAGPYGKAFELSASATKGISWSGRLLGFTGMANNQATQVGLRGIKFVQLRK